MAELPAHVRPMLAQLSVLPDDLDQWSYEVKWDGVRAIAFIEDGSVRLESRRLLDVSHTYPELAGLAEAIAPDRAILDGEIVVLEGDGRSSFEHLQSRLGVRDPRRIERLAAQAPATLMAFDLLWLDDEDLMDATYVERRDALDGLGLGDTGEHWRVPQRFSDGPALWRESGEQQLEGIVCKRLASTYVQDGRRASDWRKVRHVRRQEFVIGGWIPGEGRREETIGALLVGYYDGDELRYAARVGTGFTDALLARLVELLRPLRTEASPFTGRQPERGAIFARPELVGEVDFREWTRAGTLRHPAFKGLRDDKDARGVVREEPAAG